MLTGWSSHTGCVSCASCAVLLLLRHVCTSLQKQTWKGPEDSHINFMAVLHYSFNVCISRICHRHEENTHNTWGAVSFMYTDYLPTTLHLFPPTTFPLFDSKENHVITFIDEYQRLTPCKQSVQAVAELQQQCRLCRHTCTSEQQQLSDAAATHSTSILCGQTASDQWATVNNSGLAKLEKFLKTGETDAHGNSGAGAHRPAVPSNFATVCFFHFINFSIAK